MGKINNVSSTSLPAANSVNQPDRKAVKIKLEFDPKTLGATKQRNGQFSPTRAVTENVVETALLKHFGFNADDAADIARVKQLLQTGDSPLAALKTTGELIAVYNNRTGKYEIFDSVEKNLYLKLQGKAAEVKTQIEREKQSVASNPANPNDVIAARNGITNNRRAELDNKFKNQLSISAPNLNQSEKAVKSVTGAIESITGTTDPFAATEFGKQFNRLSVSALRLTGKAMELSNYFNEKLNDSVRSVAPDSIYDLLNQTDKTNRENAQALQNAGSAVTNEDTFIDEQARRAGLEIPVTEDLANKIMYFPEAIPNAIDSAVKGDFKDDDGSYSDRVGKIIGGLNPAGDIRDIIANGKNVVAGKNGAWVGLGAAVVGGVPIIGDGGKIFIKAEKEAIDDIAAKLIKNGVEKEAAKKIAKQEVEKLVKQAVEKRYDEIARSGHAVQRHGESITEHQLDERAMYGKDPITGTTDDAFRKNPDGTAKAHKSSKDATKFTSKESLVKSENFVRTSKEYEDAVKAANATGDDYIVVKDIKLEDIYGKNYKDQVFGKTRLGTKTTPTGSVTTDFTDGTVNAKFYKDSKGKWILDTMFPEPK